MPASCVRNPLPVRQPLLKGLALSVHPPMQGQALVLALFLLAAGAAGLLQLFNSGQAIQDKTRLTHAVDAAAYSGALVQARALNFLGYTNRALVAHQVAMAHLVTLAAWAQFGDAQGRRVARSNPPANLIAGFFGPGQGAAYLSARGLGGRIGAQAQWGSGGLALAYAEHDRVVHDVLVRAQVAVQQSMAESRREAMRAVLAANDHATPAVLDPTLLSDTLPGYVLRYGGQARERLKALVEASVEPYGFLAARNDVDRSLLPIDKRCPLARHELRRRGSTALRGLDTWRALDTHSYHALRSNKWIGCYYREYPMGYGMVRGVGSPPDDDIEYVDQPPENFSEESFWRWVQRMRSWDLLNVLTNPYASSLAVSGQASWPGRGLPSFAEIAGAGRPGEASSLRFAVRVYRPVVGAASPASTSATAAGNGASSLSGAGAMRMASPAAGGVVAAIAAAETFYARPAQRADGRHEMASLFQPYWHARLTPVRDDERMRARSLQGGR
jgi:hypothetical protein